jgi:hypothetical protein
VNSSAVALQTLGIDRVHDIDVDVSKHRDRKGSIRSEVVVIRTSFAIQLDRKPLYMFVLSQFRDANRFPVGWKML